MRFSEEHGFRKVRTAVQREEMDDSLRNGLWNILHGMLFKDPQFAYGFSVYQPSPLDNLVHSLWLSHFDLPVDEAPQGIENQIATLRDFFFKARWDQIYDLVGFILAWLKNPQERVAEINRVLEAKLSAWRYVSGRFVEITSKAELSTVSDAIEQADFVGAAQHLTRALELLADRKSPDPRNSIKESISAVESATKQIAGTRKATLEDAIKALEKRGALHPCLKAGFSKLYAYTSDQGGIRHAMLDEPNLTKADALFFLVTCSAFINYLKSKT